MFSQIAHRTKESGRKLRVCFEWTHLRRTGFITVVVGTWLTLFNQSAPLFAGEWGWRLFVQVVLNYATPFVVSNAGLLSRRDE